MTDFRNAYHFVPRQPETELAGSEGTEPKLTKPLETDPTAYGMGKNVADGHAAYALGTTSGRLICTITLECPTVIGAQRTSNNKEQKKTDEGKNDLLPALVEPFLYRSKPAIPASSLKGMISAIAESASRAPYRVLKNMQLTVAYPVVVGRKADGTALRKTARHWIDRSGQQVNNGVDVVETKMESSHAYFPENLRPLGLGPVGLSRQWLHSVETMFGFVAEADGKTKGAGREKLTSAAGKLRLSNALPCGTWTEAPIEEFFLNPERGYTTEKLPNTVKLTLLKEQGQPMKRPERQKDHLEEGEESPELYKELNSATPNFYFFQTNNPKAYVSKKSFAEKSPATFSPQGGKFYLHTHDAASEPWKARQSNPPTKAEMDGIDRKAAARILAPDVTFRFTIDFDNLTDIELRILCFALRPTRKFRHKIGLGKGLGLGSVRVDIDDMIVIDRNRRYQKDALFVADERTKSDGSGRATAERLAHAHTEWLKTADKPALTALLAIGETHAFESTEGDPALPPVVWVPLSAEKFHKRDSAAAELESYEWFSQNDLHAEKKQTLEPIRKDGTIPTLTPTVPTFTTSIIHVRDEPGKPIVACAAPVKGADKTMKYYKFGHPIRPDLCAKHGITSESIGQKIRVKLAVSKPDSPYLPDVISLSLVR